ncbi:phosphatase PAP2 family protein [Caldisericum exile]|uniref:Hypothetical membrane protein n=1 Tax=Caldisericum exile (strain DSM 21853 / NBRC 104410 / AZM16c01) TaxID=511051 RepID=A0A7U6GDY0_CALEA|nr:phosphatase PAP2 family protein [Caldisericum exile]BAL80640.1 hypothetical membrane protein [Caldisericum exile AZM16c01]
MNIMEFLKKNYKLYLINTVLAVVIYYTSKIYDFTNHATANVHVLATSFDKLVPFIPQFIVIYNSLEPVIYLTLLFFFIFHPRIFTPLSLSFITLFLVSNFVYVVFQTYVPRPQITIGNNYFVNEVVKLYSSDNPYNCFPSLHCGTSALASSVWFVKKKYKLIAYLMSIWAILIILSTQFLKQHVIADIIGAPLAIGIFLVFYKAFNLKNEY